MVLPVVSRHIPCHLTQCDWFWSHLTITPSTVQFSWYLANLSHLWWCVSLSIGTFFLVAEWNPASFNAFLTVWGWTGCVRVELLKFVAWTALSSLPELICQIMDCLSQIESLEGQPPGLFSLLASMSFPILLIVTRLDYGFDDRNGPVLRDKAQKSI